MCDQLTRARAAVNGFTISHTDDLLAQSRRSIESIAGQNMIDGRGPRQLRCTKPFFGSLKPAQTIELRLN